MAYALGYHPEAPQGSAARGGVPEWPKGADCKSVGVAYGGSNPPPPTTHIRRARRAPRASSRASIAQLAEHFHGKEGVIGSNPIGGSIGHMESWRRSSVGQSSGIIIRVSEVRVLPPLLHLRPRVRPPDGGCVLGLSMHCGSMHDCSEARIG